MPNATPAEELQAIEGFGPGAVFAAGKAGGGTDRAAIVFFDGGTWANVFQSNTDNTLIFALAFTSPSQGWAGGEAATLFQWDGGSWGPSRRRGAR